MWVHFWTGDAPKSNVGMFQTWTFRMSLIFVKKKIKFLRCAYGMEVRTVLESPQNNVAEYLSYIDDSNIYSSYKCAFGIDVGEVGGKAPEK